jgi:hypothetical protein
MLSLVSNANAWNTGLFAKFRRRSMRDSVDDFTSGTYGKQRPTQRPTES